MSLARRERETRVHDLLRDGVGRVVEPELRTEDGGTREARAGLINGTDGPGSLVRTRAAADGPRELAEVGPLPLALLQRAAQAVAQGS